MTSPVMGFMIVDKTDGAVSPVITDFSTVGLVLPSEDANTSMYPLDTAVMINSSDPTAVGGLGTGPLYKAVNAIQDQLGDLQTAARVVVVRVAEGDTDDDTIANICGSPPQNNNPATGLHALLNAPATLGITPRLIGCPGFTGQVTYGVTTPVITNQGTGYTSATVSFSPSGATATATCSGGKVTKITLTNPGDYASGTTVTMTISGTGTGATGTVSLVELANPVAALLPTIASALLGIAVVNGPSGSLVDATLWRQTLNSYRLHLCDNQAIVADGADTAYEDLAARVIGLFVRTDFKHGGLPSHAPANQAIQNILGLKRQDSFSLFDGATDAQVLLANNIGPTVRGNATDGAIDDSGFIYLGVHTASDLAPWNFVNKRRIRDYVHLQMVKAIRRYFGGTNVTPHSVQCVMNAMTVVLSMLKQQDAEIGFYVKFMAENNSVAALRNGWFTVDFGAEEPAPIMQITINSALDDAALVEELALLAGLNS